jgi:hypothetical protein
MSDTSVHHVAGIVPQQSLQGPCPPPLVVRKGPRQEPPSANVPDSVALEPARACDASVRWPRVFPGL